VGPDDKPILERIEKVLGELSRSIGMPQSGRNAAGEDPPYGSGAQTAAEPTERSDASDRLNIAIAWIRARKMRDSVLGGDLFFDPAWSILLELYLHHRQRTAVSITALCIAAGVPSSTGLRWVTLLERRNLVARDPDPFDRRKIYARLTDDGIKKVEDALDGAGESNRQLGIERIRRVN
jgi:DNA-binding MarR family transcriptional regulator